MPFPKPTQKINFLPRCPIEVIFGSKSHIFPSSTKLVKAPSPKEVVCPFESTR
ncbi:hypothetical protein LINGRAHAP2_LOCUS1 [Linum grandiflorum]